MKTTLLQGNVSLRSGAPARNRALAPLLESVLALHVTCPPFERANHHSGDQPSEDCAKDSANDYAKGACDKFGGGHVPVFVYEIAKPAHCRAPNAARVAARIVSIHVLIESPAIG